MSRDVGKGLDPKRDERKTSCTAGDGVCRGRRDVTREMSYTTGDESCRGRQDVPREMRHTAGGGCRRQVWRRKTSRGAEDTLEGGGGVGSRSRVRDGKAWRKGVTLTRGTFGRTVGVGGTFGSGLEVSGKQPGGGNRVRSGKGSIRREVGSGCGRRGTCRLMSGESHQRCTYASIV